MSISSISGQAAYAQTAAAPTGQTATEKSNSNKKEEEASGVVYESSSDTATKETKNINRQAVISQLKADSEKRSAQLMNLVSDMFTKQGKVYNNANDIWSILASGDFTVTPEVKKQAEEDISSDGYWGVKQTSDRILSFAEALSGGDPEVMDKMKEAFQDGYDQATKSWGKELPSLCKDTYDAVMDKFDKWSKDNASDSEGTEENK